MSGDKTTAPIGPPGPSTAEGGREGRRRACSHQVLGSSGGSGARNRLLGDGQSRMFGSATPPSKETTLYGTKVQRGQPDPGASQQEVVPVQPHTLNGGPEPTPGSTAMLGR